MTNTLKDDARLLLGNVVQQHGSGEIRPQQELMVESIADAIHASENLIVQAGTGVGKSLGYLIPAVCSGKRVVIATATNQLSEQLATLDLPFLKKVVSRSTKGTFSDAILKGRANYLCLRKVEELESLDQNESSKATVSSPLDSLLPVIVDEDSPTKDNPLSLAQKRGEEVSKIVEWAKDQTIDGDRSNGPVVSDETWKTVSSTPAECPGASVCPFGEVCFTEKARRKANAANIVITNHALVATELKDPENTWGLLGSRDLVIFDESHELDDQLSNAWGCSVTGRAVEEIARVTRRAVPASDTVTRDAIEELSQYGEKLSLALEDAEVKLITEDWKPPFDSIVRGITLSTAVIAKRVVTDVEKDSRLALAANSVLALMNDMTMLINADKSIVRWIGEGDGKKALSAAPLRVGPLLQESLAAQNTNMIATSATVRVGKTFDIPVRNLALDEAPSPHNAVDVGTPFDYPKQSILYIPSPDSFPAPVGRERFEHTEAVLETLVKIVKAAGGRTLALSSTSAGARRMAERLRDEVSTPIISQFDGPPAVMAKMFAEDEESTLCATMGMWHGLNVPGKSLSAVVIDKIPFARMDDPLTSARMKDADERGGNGFMDIYVANATNKLAQGFGRLVRNSTDRGMVAILDPRLKSKRYGSVILQTLPDAWLTSNEEVALTALNRVVEG